MAYSKPRLLHYRLAQAVSWLVATFVFKRKILRNELKGKTGPFVVIANHQAALDFVNLIGSTDRPMSFVISNSFYSTLPIKRYLDKMGVIPKQQFQTTLKDMKRIRAVIENGEPVVIYPAGLMCEDGLSTPIPAATYKFLKWLDADVYVARSKGTYFVMPKWTSGFRPGRTYLDIYRLFSREELAAADLEEVRRKTDDALLFDAYREQDEMPVKYKNGGNIDGLENVLYQCPHCGTEFSVQAVDGRTLRCAACGYAQTTDEYAFLHNDGAGEEIRYVSDWSRRIYRKLKEAVQNAPDTVLSSATAIHMIDPKQNKFVPVGEGHVTLSREQFSITDTIYGKPVDLQVPLVNVPTLPFSPGKYFEVQHGSTIYRCLPTDGYLVMKFINLVKIFYELKEAPAKEPV